MNYELRLFAKTRAQDYAQLFDDQVNSVDEATRARRDWWCFKNPNGGAFAVILSGAKVVSTCYLSRKRIRINGQILHCYEIGETATDPNHQRKGLFSKLVIAMTAHAAAEGASNVYGTPNPQSAPGYVKLGFKNVDLPDHALLLLPLMRYWLFRRGRPAPPSARKGRWEIDPAQYVEQTIQFPRLNDTTEAYLQWRLATSPREYRFFRVETRSGVLHCVARTGELGNHPAIVVAEHYLNGTKAPIDLLAPLLRKALSGSFAFGQYAGIYVLAQTPKRFTKAAQIWHRAIVHRNFPICVQNDVNSVAAKFAALHFQLSDCDIG